MKPPMLDSFRHFVQFFELLDKCEVEFLPVSFVQFPESLLGSKGMRAGRASHRTLFVERRASQVGPEIVVWVRRTARLFER